VEAITEELCGHEFSSSTISRIVQKLDEELERFARRRLEGPYPYLILDARYEKVREDGAVRSQAVLMAIGITWEGRRNILAVELASRESLSSWKELLASLTLPSEVAEGYVKRAARDKIEKICCERLPRRDDRFLQVFDPCFASSRCRKGMLFF
jgi:hypothetical protein